MPSLSHLRPLSPSSMPCMGRSCARCRGWQCVRYDAHGRGVLMNVQASVTVGSFRGVTRRDGGGRGRRWVGAAESVLFQCRRAGRTSDWRLSHLRICEATCASGALQQIGAGGARSSPRFTVQGKGRAACGRGLIARARWVRALRSHAYPWSRLGQTKRATAPIHSCPPRLDIAVRWIQPKLQR